MLKFVHSSVELYERSLSVRLVRSRCQFMHKQRPPTDHMDDSSCQMFDLSELKILLHLLRNKHDATQHDLAI